MKKLFSLDYKKDRAKVNLIMLGVGVASFLIAFLPYFIRGNYFVWEYDGLIQHSTFIDYFVNNGWLSNIGEYDFNLGLGGDSLFSFAYYMLCDPAILIYLLFMKVSAGFAYSMMVVSKFLAVYLVMYAYLKHRKVRPIVAIVGAVVYMLGGYSLYAIPRHPQFATGLIYLPILIWGIENILEKKRPYIFILGITLSILSNYYYFYMIALISVIYAVVYYLTKIKNSGERFSIKHFISNMLKLFGFAVVGIALAGFLLIPVLYGMMTSARGSSKGVTPFNLLNTISIFVQMLCYYNAPSWTIVGINLFVLIGAIYCVLNRKNEYRYLVIILSACAFLPIFGYVMNAFNYVTNRWFFALLFVLVVSGALGYDHMLNNPIKNEGRLFKLLCAFFTLLIGIGTILGLAKIMLKFNLNVYVCIAIIIALLLGVVTLSVLAYKKVRPPKNLAKLIRPKLFITASLICSVLLGLIYNISYSAHFSDSNAMAQIITSDEQYVATANAGEFYRTDIGKMDYKVGGNLRNSNLNNGYMSTYSYNSCFNGYVYDFLVANSLDESIATLGIAGFDSRVAYEALFNVNYYIAKDSLVPYGFSKVDGTDSLYANENVLPLGTLFYNTISEEYFESVDIEERGNLMLEALVLEDKSEGYDYNSNCEKLESEPILTNCTLQNDRIVADEKASISYNLTGVSNSEVYLKMQNFNFDFNTNYEKVKSIVNGQSSKSVEVSVMDRTQIVYCEYQGSMTYTGAIDRLINLGYFEDSDDLTVTINLPKGEYTFDELSFYAYDMDVFDANVDALRGESLQLDDFANFDGNNLTGSISLEKEGWLFLSIPYSTGWTASVDGKNAEIVRANYGFMAIKLSSGQHTIELNYTTPNLKLGVAVSIAGTIAFVAIIATDVIISVRRRKKQKANK